MNITKVDENIYRGPRPTLEQTRHFRSILCLESGLYEILSDNVYEEVDNCQIFNTKFVGLALNVFSPPTPYQLRKALNYIDYLTEKYPWLYIHCKAGVDRTGVVIAAYRVVKMGWSVDAAIKEMKQMGFHWYYYWWLPSIRKNLRLIAHQ